MKDDIIKYTFQGTRDGRVSHELYNTHSLMVRRCYDASMPNYKNYGAKGVSVDPRWLGPDGFWTFVNDMPDRPEGYSLDRINPEGNYSKENCRWADRRTQAVNTRMESFGETSPVKGVHWCKRDLCWIAQTTLNGKRTAVGRFSYENFEEAVVVVNHIRDMKLMGVSDSQIYEEFVLAQRVGLKNSKMRRNKTSQYWGVSKNKRGKWIAYVDGTYLGISDTEEGANQLVVQHLELLKAGGEYGHKT